jgi:hypothetical protein
MKNFAHDPIMILLQTERAGTEISFVVLSSEASKYNCNSDWLDDRGIGVRDPVGARIFSSTRRRDRFWGPLSDGCRGFFTRDVKLTTLPTNAEVRNTWIYTSTPPYAFMA